MISFVSIAPCSTTTWSCVSTDRSRQIRDSADHGKGLSEERILSVYHRFRQKHPHVWLVGFFILGLPEETEQTSGETARLIDKLEDLYPVFNAAVPTPGTRLWDQCVKDGRLLFDSSNAWQKSFVFGRKKDDNDNKCWTMKGLESIPQTFVIQPYHLSLDSLQDHYRRFQELGVQRLKAIKTKLSSLPRIP